MTSRLPCLPSLLSFLLDPFIAYDGPFQLHTNIFTGSVHGRPLSNQKEHVSQGAKSMLYDDRAMWIMVSAEDGAISVLR